MVQRTGYFKFSVSKLIDVKMKMMMATKKRDNFMDVKLTICVTK
jgi:hypothetical protein